MRSGRRAESDRPQPGCSVSEIRDRPSGRTGSILDYGALRPGYTHGMKVRDAIALIENDGWHMVATRGSHRQFKHPTKPGRVTIAGKLSDDLAPGTRNSILKQAGLKERP